MDYSLPLVIPDDLPEEQKAKIVIAAVNEANALYHFAFDRPYLYKDNPMAMPTADPLREWTWQTRKEVISRCHLAWERNPLANAAVGLTTLFSVGEGMTVTYSNKDVEEVVEEFRQNIENAVEQYEKQFSDSLQVDGELFIQFHKSEDGQTVITCIPPWEIAWIKTERGFNRRVVSYHRQGSQSNGVPGDFENVDTDIPADEIIHVSINRLAYETRGRPEIYRILPWLKAYKDWLEGRARQNHWRGAILWDVSIKDALPAQVAAKRAQYRQPPSPGSLLVHNDRETWSSVESKVGASDVSEDGRQIKLMSAAGLKLPEYMLSDGQNSNLASASAQQLPALKKFVDFQDVQVYQVWTPIYKRVIENAIDAGILTEMIEEQDEDGEPIFEEPTQADKTAEAIAAIIRQPKAQLPTNGNGATQPAIDNATGAPVPPVAIPMPAPLPPPKPKGKPKMIKACEAFSVSGPELEADDPKTLAEALQIATAQEWASNETASQAMGYDYRQEKKQIDREKQEANTAAMQGFGNGVSVNNPAMQAQRAKVSGAPMPMGNSDMQDMMPQGESFANVALDTQLASLRDAMREAMLQARDNAMTAEVRQALARTDGLEKRLTIVGESVQSLTTRERRENDMLESIALLLNAIELSAKPPAPVITLDESIIRRVMEMTIPPQPAPPIIMLDENMIQRVAEITAEATASRLSVVSQEVVTRDSAGRPYVIQRVTADGGQSYYQINRNSAGSIESLTRLEAYSTQ